MGSTLFVHTQKAMEANSRKSKAVETRTLEKLPADDVEEQVPAVGEQATAVEEHVPVVCHQLMPIYSLGWTWAALGQECTTRHSHFHFIPVYFF